MNALPRDYDDQVLSMICLRLHQIGTDASLLRPSGYFLFSNPATVNNVISPILPAIFSSFEQWQVNPEQVLD